MSGRVARAALAGTALLAGLTACGGSGGDKAGGSNQDGPVVLTLANPDTDPTNFDTPDFIAAVERLSGRSIRIEQTHGWRSDAPIEEFEKRTIEDVQAGKVDLAVIPARTWDLVGVLSFRALVAPFLVDSYDVERRVIESPLAVRMLDGVERLGLVGLAIIPGALRYPLGVSRALVQPADYGGTTIGIRPAGVAEATFRALGAATEAYAPGSVSHLDGAELDPSTIVANRYDQQGRALTANVVLWPRAMTIVMNRKTFDALAPRQQDILRRAGREAIAPMLARFRPDEQAFLSSVCDGSQFSLVTASAADLARLREAVQPVYQELERDPLTQQLIAEIRKMRGEKLSAAKTTLRCSGAGAAARAGESALDGVWMKNVTAQALRDVGASEGEADYLQGTYRVEFHDGRWDRHQLNTARTCSGTYVLDGEVVRFRVETARPAPSGYCTPGYTGAVTWSVYRNKLTFARIPGRPAPLEAIAKPFTRAG